MLLDMLIKPNFFTILFISLILASALSLVYSSASFTNTDTEYTQMSQLGNTMPVIFLSHAAPVLIMDANETLMGMKNDCHPDSEAVKWYKSIPSTLGLVGENKPKALLMISAHYEARGPALITANPVPSLLYDYYGFPKYTYDVKYPAKGDFQTAERVRDLLTEFKIPAQLDLSRGIDHGSFIPLLYMYPEADVPIIQLSVFSHYDPIMHMKMGVALRKLRDEGVLIIGSGQATHGPPGYKKEAAQFLESLSDLLDSTTEDELSPKYTTSKTNSNEATVSTSIDSTGTTTSTISAKSTEKHSNTSSSISPSSTEYLGRFMEGKRAKGVLQWKSLPHSRLAHPSDDHFIPMASIVGAAYGDEEAEIIGDHWMMNFHSLRSWVIGDYPNKK